MDNKFEGKIEAFIENRMGNISVELTGEDIKLDFEANESQEQLEAVLNKEQKKLFFDYDLKSNLRSSRENELYYRLGFYEGVQMTKDILGEKK